MRERTQYDLPLLIITISLMGIGVVIVYSASAILATDRFGDSYYFLKKQALFGAFAVAAMMVMMNIPYTLLKRLAYPVLGLSLFFLILLWIPGIGYRVVTAAGCAQEYSCAGGFFHLCADDFSHLKFPPSQPKLLAFRG